MKRNFHERNIDFLWKSFLNGDDKCFSIIYQQHIERLLSYGKKLSSDTGLLHDCIQEVFIDLFLKREKLGGNIKNLKSYLFVALRNALIKKIIRSKKFEQLDVEKSKDELVFDIEYSFQDKLIEQEISTEIKDKLWEAINKLPSKQKEIIYLKFEEEMDYPEISDILNISVESARKLLYRALLSLREKVAPITIGTLFLIFSKKS